MNPDNDGIDHINVYSKGKTFLGRALSNFFDSPFEHPEHGSFRNVEGFWYWLMTGREELRTLPGWKCKEFGKQFKNYRTHPTEAELEVAYRAKLSTRSDLLQTLKENTLPLAHYYVYNGRVVEATEWLWTAKLWEKIARE